MIGYDENDNSSYETNSINIDEMLNFDTSSIKIGYYERFSEDSLMKIAIADLIKINVELKSITPKKINLPYFRDILTSDMKRDLPKYISKYGSKDLMVKNVDDIVKFNDTDSILYAPYNQVLFNEILRDTVSDVTLEIIKKKTKKDASKYLTDLMIENDIDVFISVDNSMAGIAAAAHYPALTIPMGYRKNGQPSNLTFVTSSRNEQLLYNIGFAYEKISNKRLIPKNYN